MGELHEICERLRLLSNARSVLLLDGAGGELARSGDVGVTAAARLSTVTAEVRVGGRRAILVVLYDKETSLGLVRLRVKKASEELARLLH